MLVLEGTNQAFSEVYDIVHHMEETLYNKIPKGFIKMIEQNRDLNYKVNIDYSKDINNQELLRETRIILSLIYRDYLCSGEKKKELLYKDKTELERIEQELREKYNPDNLFKNKVQPTEYVNEEVTDLVEYKENVFTKIFNFIKRIFNFKKSY